MSTETDRVLEVVRTVVVEVLEIDGGLVTAGTSLKALGANSLDRVEIVTMVIEDLGLHMPLRELAHLTNIGELVGFLGPRLEL